MANWVFSIVDSLGAAGVGLLIFLENLIPPIPSGGDPPAGGVPGPHGCAEHLADLARRDGGSVAGAVVLYGLGAWLGYDRLRALAGKRWFILTDQKDLDRGEESSRSTAARSCCWAGASR